MTDTVWTKVDALDQSLDEQKVTVRGYLSTSRVVGKGVFAVIRSSMSTVQAIAFEGKTTPAALVKYITDCTKESIVDVSGVIRKVDDKIASATQSDVEVSCRICCQSDFEVWNSLELCRGRPPKPPYIRCARLKTRSL
jgi:aspartyl-tRNA synthetase